MAKSRFSSAVLPFSDRLLGKQLDELLSKQAFDIDADFFKRPQDFALLVHRLIESSSPPNIL
jgi:hypothetical protein